MVDPIKFISPPHFDTAATATNINHEIYHSLQQNNV